MNKPSQCSWRTETAGVCCLLACGFWEHRRTEGMHTERQRSQSSVGQRRHQGCTRGLREVKNGNTLSRPIRPWPRALQMVRSEIQIPSTCFTWTLNFHERNFGLSFTTHYRKQFLTLLIMHYISNRQPFWINDKYCNVFILGTRVRMESDFFWRKYLAGHYSEVFICIYMRVSHNALQIYPF